MSDTSLLESINLDKETTKEELLEAIKKQITGAENLNLALIKWLRETRGGTQTALLSVPASCCRKRKSESDGPYIDSAKKLHQPGGSSA